jgi:hypothetical protein
MVLLCLCFRASTLSVIIFGSSARQYEKNGEDKKNKTDTSQKLLLGPRFWSIYTKLASLGVL